MIKRKVIALKNRMDTYKRQHQAWDEAEKRGTLTVYLLPALLSLAVWKRTDARRSVDDELLEAGSSFTVAAAVIRGLKTLLEYPQLASRVAMATHQLKACVAMAYSVPPRKVSVRQGRRLTPQGEDADEVAEGDGPGPGADQDGGGTQTVSSAHQRRSVLFAYAFVLWLLCSFAFDISRNFVRFLSTDYACFRQQVTSCAQSTAAQAT